MNNKEIGMGLAGFLLSISTLEVFIQNKIFTTQHVVNVIALCREYPNGPGKLLKNPRILETAEEALQSAEAFLHLSEVRPKSSA